MKDPSIVYDVENRGSMPPEEAIPDDNRHRHSNEHADGTSVASESSRQIEDKKSTHKLVSSREVFSFARTPKSKLCIVGSFICACISGACMPAIAFYFSNALENLSASTANEDYMDSIRKLTYSMMILGVIIFTSMTLQATLIETAASEMTMTLKTDWFKALLRQDIAYYDIMDVSGEATIISVNASKYRRGMGRKLALSVQFVITFIGGLVYAFWSSWQVSLAVLAVAPFLSLSLLFLLKVNTSQSARANASYAEAGSIVSTSVSSIRTILALNAVEIMLERFKSATKRAFEGAVSELLLLGMANGANMAAMLLTYVIITLFGSWLLYDQVTDSGCDPSGTVEGNERCNPAGVDVFAALFGVSFAASVVPQISTSIESFAAAREACYPAFAVIHRSTAANDDNESNKNREERAEELALHRGGKALPKYVIDSSSDTGRKLDKIEGNIEFRNVVFHYPTRQEIDVFNDFSLKVEAGMTVALVGVSGSGKSTAVQLIERFYDPVGGSITLDGVDLKDLNVKWLRQHIALVQQEPKLFECSIRQNIALGAPGVTDEQIEAAARMANADDFIRSFPKGYDTEVGALGDQLSGGQRQRICIARCLVSNPKILLLDEATSALDSHSEATVQEALDELMAKTNMTTIVIAHRLSTIRSADMIAVVDSGRVVESGTHEELLEKKSHYFRLVEAQKSKHFSEPPETSTPTSSEHESGRASSGQDSVFEDSDCPVIEFDNVHFEYPTRPDAPVFCGLNLQVRQGETLAIVGPSGSGKSTVIQLMECFYRPSLGTVKYLGTDMKELNVAWLRDQLGLVSQQPTLFDCSIEENIRYSLPDASHAQVVEAAIQANAHDFISAFPEAYGTSVGQGSTLISGGQKQRICIARALVKKPKVLLLDEATSALDSQSEKVVQEALDKIMSDRTQTCVVIAHRLSTIQSADRIAVIEKGKVREIGTHEELMAKPDGRYRYLQSLQDLSMAKAEKVLAVSKKEKEKDDARSSEDRNEVEDQDEEREIDKKEAAANANRARLLASSDAYFLGIGGIGAVFVGLIFPGWGFLFAHMIEVLFTPVLPCPPVPDSLFPDCDAYYEVIADDMQDRSLKIFYGYTGMFVSTFVGFTLLFWGFGQASERMNKRIRDSAFKSLLRQEIAWHDQHSPNALASRLSDDAALIHAFANEPVRSLTSSLASVAVGIVVSFVFMWPFALLSMAIIPFLAFGTQMEINLYYGEDEGDVNQVDASSPGAIVIEAVSNIRTVASLSLEQERVARYARALEDEDPHPVKTNIVKGGASGAGQFMQMWGIGLMFFWGGWLLVQYPNTYTFLEYNISMYALFFSLYGLTIAFEGAVDRKKANLAAARIFELMDRQSEIDPLSTKGKTLLHESSSFSI